MSDNLLPVYQTLDLPLRSLLTKISNREWILPAIQREFIWSDDQICRLFDSMMRGYPFGTFLFWEITGETAAKFKFYEFMRRYHERDANTCQEIAYLPSDRLLTAVLDGQQRLTALNIGFIGSRSHKLPYKRKQSATAYPETFLYIDLLADEGDKDIEMAHRFAFLTPERAVADSQPDTKELWFRVGDILKFQTAGEIFGVWQPLVSAKGIVATDTTSTRIYNLLSRLQRLVHETALVSCYREKDQNLERVLDIFIRMNSGGTALSKSDLLFSVAVANWGELDARKEVNSTLEQINNAGSSFMFSKDFVLKSGLTLANAKSIGFKVENFNKDNMKALEAAWPSIKNALLLTVELVASFGFTGKTLRADSALIPIAFYVHFRQLSDDYLTSAKYAVDRRAIKGWMIRTYLKTSGIWGSGLDTLLTYLRDTIKQHGRHGFPVAEIEAEMGRRGKSLTFTQEEIEDLLDEPYASGRVFPLLSLLFDIVDTSKYVHVDHIFPISRFSISNLNRAGVPLEKHYTFQILANSLPNLHLLEGQVNQEKLAKMPTEWLTSRYASIDDRRRYALVHDLGELPTSLNGFEAFAVARRGRLLKRTQEILFK